jgi:hypothetical protein
MDDSLDVFIPLHEKDLKVLPACVASLRRYVEPHAARIIVIPRSDDLRTHPAIRRMGVETLSELDFGELTPRAAMPEIMVKGKLRTGWYFQQFIKWGVRRFSRTPSYLVMDADTVLIAPLVVSRAGQPVFDQTAQHHSPYFDTFSRMFGNRPARSPSFIINYMVFSVQWLDELIGDIHGRFPGTNWDSTIMSLIDRTEMSSFSEFETYGYWLMEHKAGEFSRGDGRNREMRVRRRHFHWWYRWQSLQRGYNTISYHSHRR